MKKIVFIATLIAIFTACTNDEIIPTTAVDKEVCEVTFSVVIPQATVASRAFNDWTNVEINNLRLLLFDENGLLVANQTAEEVTKELSDGVTKRTYQVTLGQTEDKRIIHFVANYSGSIGSEGSEDEILSALKVSGTEDAYWQRMVLENGIHEDKDGESSSIGTVHLIRNFARITVADNTGQDFLKGYILVNKPDEGTVAPYFRNEKGGFAEFTPRKTYSEFVKDGYYGVEPAENMTYTDETEFTTTDKYVYERNHSADKVEKPTFIIINGHYGEGNYFYRVDIAQNYKYYNLLRNFHYTLNITGVAGPGYATEEEAKNGASFNNIDVGLKVEEITDGTNTLKVTPTDVTVVNGTTELYIDYEYTGTDGGTVSCNPTSEGKVINRVENESENSRFKVTIPFYKNGVEGGKQTEAFTISAGGLSRKVRITLINQFSLSEPEVTSPSLDEYLYSFNLPSGMVESMFPLELLVYEKTCSFTPASGEQLAVELIDDPDTGKGTWAYKKVVKWTEYDPAAGTSVACRFKANEGIEAPKTFTILNRKGYFKEDESTTELDVPHISGITLADVAYGTGKKTILAFTVKESDAGRLRIQPDNLDLPATSIGSGKQKMTLTTTTLSSAGTVSVYLDDKLWGKVSNKRIFTVDDETIEVDKGILTEGTIVEIYTDEAHTHQIASGTIKAGTQDRSKFYLNKINQLTNTEISLDENSILYFYTEKTTVGGAISKYVATMSAADFFKGGLLTLKKQY